MLGGKKKNYNRKMGMKKEGGKQKKGAKEKRKMEKNVIFLVIRGNYGVLSRTLSDVEKKS